MVFEVVADLQKQAFRADPANKGEFIRTGLWSRSRHPNYFGEILVWVGVFLVAAPVLQGWQWVAVLSPLFVILLLTGSAASRCSRSAPTRSGAIAPTTAPTATRRRC